jgi:hypothetical protein
MMLLLNTSDVLIILYMPLFVGKQPLEILLSILIKLKLLYLIACSFVAITSDIWNDNAK